MHLSKQQAAGAAADENAPPNSIQRRPNGAPAAGAPPALPAGAKRAGAPAAADAPITLLAAGKQGGSCSRMESEWLGCMQSLVQLDVAVAHMTDGGGST